MPGLIEFYLDRVHAARNYGPRGSLGMIDVIIRCVRHDKDTGMLTDRDYKTIMKACDDLFYDTLTGGLK